MQTPAEEYLIHKVATTIKESNSLNNFKILNIGAGKSTVLESNILNLVGNEFTCDRMDIVDCCIKHPVVDECYITSVESMPEIQSNKYDLAFANYVFEHIVDLEKVGAEIHRILKSSGCFITSLPNPTAPEFVLSKHTPTNFHQLLKGSHAHETHYAYKNILELVSIFEKYFSVIEIKYWSNTLGYLYRIPVINIIGKVYDKAVNYINIKTLMGDVCIVFKK